MIKKALCGLVALGLLGTFILGREAKSYFRAGCQNVRNAVKAEVPIEFEIARARSLVDQLVPDIRQCMHVIAEQQVDVEQLRSTLTQKTAELDKQRETILTLRTDLGSGRSTFTYASHSYSSNDVKRDLSTRFDRFKAAEEILTADRKILSAREQTLGANSEKLDGMMQAKKDLEVKLEQLQARVQTMKAAETVSKLAIDDSNLSHARQLITELNKQLDVKQRMLDVEGKFVGLIQVDKPTATATPNVEEQIDAYFGQSKEPENVAVK